MPGWGSEVQAPTLLTVDEAAAWCRITKSTLNHLRTTGGSRRRSRRKALLLDAGDLLAWLDAQREQVA